MNLGVVLSVVLLAQTGQALEIETLRERLRATEFEVESLRREVPEASEQAWMELQAFVTRRLGDVDVTAVGTEPTLLDDGRPSPVALCRMDIAGRVPFENVQRLLDAVARLPRIIDFEPLRLDAAPENEVALQSRLTWVCWDGEVRSPVPPSSAVSPEERIMAAERAALLRMQSMHKTIIDFKARFRPARLTHVLGALGEAATGEALALTAFRSTRGDAVIEGVTLGVAAAAAVKAAVESAGADDVKIQTSAAGDCRSFSISARFTGEKPFLLQPTKLLFDHETGVLCRRGPQPAPKRIAVKGSGSLTIHGREVDVADVFRILNELGAGNFLVDAGVKGTVDIDAESATLEEILAAMSDLTISPGPLHIVSSARTSGSPTTETNYSGEPIDLSLKNAALNDVLCLFAKITALKFIVPEKEQWDVTAFVRDIPWDQLLDTMFSAAGLKYAIDEDRVLVGTNPAVDACRARGLARREWRISPEKVSVKDVKIAAIAHVAGVSKAFAYLPGSARILLTLEPGRKLLDGQVGTAGPAGVTFRTATNEATIVPFPP